MYKSELAALITNSRMAALMIWLSTLMPTRVVAEISPISKILSRVSAKSIFRLTNDERRGSRSSLCFVRGEQRLVGTWDDQANDENATNIENDDTEERTPDGDRDVLSGCLCLTNGNTNKLGSNEGEQSINERAPEAKEN